MKSLKLISSLGLGLLLAGAVESQDQTQRRGGGITTTNVPFNGAVLFTDGTIFYWSYATNLQSSVTNAVTSINGGTSNNQYIVVAAVPVGTDFNIVTVSGGGGGTNIFHLPTASAANRGALASADWVNFQGTYLNAITNTDLSQATNSARKLVILANAQLTNLVIWSSGLSNAILIRGPMLAGTNGVITFGDSVNIFKMTNWMVTYQRGQFEMNDSGQSLYVRDGASLSAENGSPILVGVGTSTGIGASHVRFGTNDYISSGDTDSGEIVRYRFAQDITSNITNLVMRWWEVSNYVASAAVVGNIITAKSVNVTNVGANKIVSTDPNGWLTNAVLGFGLDLTGNTLEITNVTGTGPTFVLQGAPTLSNTVTFKGTVGVQQPQIRLLNTVGNGYLSFSQPSGWIPTNNLSFVITNAQAGQYLKIASAVGSAGIVQVDLTNDVAPGATVPGGPTLTIQFNQAGTFLGTNVFNFATNSIQAQIVDTGLASSDQSGFTWFDGTAGLSPATSSNSFGRYVISSTALKLFPNVAALNPNPATVPHWVFNSNGLSTPFDNQADYGAFALRSRTNWSGGVDTTNIQTRGPASVVNIGQVGGARVQIMGTISNLWAVAGNNGTTVAHINGTNQNYTFTMTCSTNLVLTNLMDNVLYTVDITNAGTFILTNFFPIQSENTAWIYHPFSQSTVSPNAVTRYQFQRHGTKTNAWEMGPQLELGAGGGIVFTTNGTGRLTISANGAPSQFAPASADSDPLIIKSNAPMTNITLYGNTYLNSANSGSDYSFDFSAIGNVKFFDGVNNALIYDMTSGLYAPAGYGDTNGLNAFPWRKSFNIDVFARSNVFAQFVYPTNVGVSQLVRTDSGGKLAAVTIGSGVAFDGTTLTGSGGSGSNFATINLTNQLLYIPEKFNGSNGVSGIALTNNWDLSKNTFKQITNYVGTNLTFTISNVIEGASLISEFIGLPGTTNLVYVQVVPTVNLKWKGWDTNASTVGITVRGGYSYTVQAFADRATNVSVWVTTDEPAPVISITTNDFVINTRYTNSNTTFTYVQCSMTLNAGVTDIAQAVLLIDQNADGTFDTWITNRIGSGVAMADSIFVGGWVTNGGIYLFTNQSTGSATATINPNSSQKVSGFVTTTATSSPLGSYSYSTSDFVATNSTANSNLTVNFLELTREIYLTNNISLTNYINMQSGINAGVKWRIIPKLVNRTVVWPAIGNSFGMRFGTNSGSVLWTTLTNNTEYWVSWDSWNTNIVATVTAFSFQ